MDTNKYVTGEHLADSAARLFQLIKKWGATPFDGVEHPFNVTVGSAPIDDLAVDYIIYDDRSEVKRFRLKRVKNGNTTYYESWWRSEVVPKNHELYRELKDRAYDNYTDVNRFFVSPETYITNGKLLNFGSIATDVDTIFAILNGDPESTDPLEKLGVLARLLNVEGKATTNATNIETLGGTVSQHTASLASLPSTYASKDTETNVRIVREILAERGASYFDGIDKNVRVEDVSVSKTDGDTIIYSPENSTFLLKRPQGSAEFPLAPKYYRNWDETDKSQYVNKDTQMARTDRFFVSKNGYIIHGQMFEADFSAILTEINAINNALEGKVEQSDFDRIVDNLTSLINEKVGNGAFNTKVNELLTLISGKASVDSLQALQTLVAKKANQQDLLNLQMELDTKVAKADFDAANEVTSAALADINSRLAGTLGREFVDSLPTAGMKENIIYMVKVHDEGDDYYNEYMWIASDNRYELIGSSKVNLNDYTSNADQARYIAANQGLSYNLSQKFGEGDTQKPLKFGEGDKIKIICVSGSASLVNIRTFNGSSYDTILANVSTGEEVTVSQGNYNNISISTPATSVITQGIIKLRIFITNSNLSFDLMTTADIDEIFANL